MSKFGEINDGQPAMREKKSRRILGRQPAVISNELTVSTSRIEPSNPFTVRAAVRGN